MFGRQRKLFQPLLACLFLAGLPLNSQTAQNSQTPQIGTVKKGAIRLDIRSSGKTIADEIAKPRINGLKVPVTSLNISPAQVPTIGALPPATDNELVNDPNQDNIQIFSGTRSFVHSTESETAIVRAKGNLIAAYNSSANAIVAPNPNGPGLVFVQILIGAYSVSKDNGETWTSAFFPPVPGSSFTFGDPALAVAPDGTVYFSQLGTDAAGNGTVQVNRSTDGGVTWSPGIVVAIDNGSDKEWIAAGPDGAVYVTWTSFQNDGSAQLRFAKSTDRGSTWKSRTIYAPSTHPDLKSPQNQLQFTQPTVDQVTNRLYIPFLHFGGSDQDFIQILVSDDGGAHFRFTSFRIPGAPLPTVLPITTPGDLNECGASPTGTTPPFVANVRQTIHSGPALGGSFTGLPRWAHATRLITQPAFFARAGRLYLAWNNSNSNRIGDKNVGSRILFIRSNDGGKTWSKQIQANPSRSSDLYHVLPSLTAEESADTNEVRIAYYTQHTDGTVDVDLAASNDGGATFPIAASRRLTTTHFGLPPTNTPLPTAANPFQTTNYDRVIAECYALGEYLGVRMVNEQIYAVWGDDRRFIRQPVSKFDPISGQVHPQEDVFFQQLQD
jgi:hypothetical protein